MAATTTTTTTTTAAAPMDDDVEMTDVDAYASTPFSPPTNSSTDRQYTIWRSRVQRELATCRERDALPLGVALHSAHLDDARGECVSELHCFVPFQDGSDALALLPLTVLRITMPFDATQHARGDAQYPFVAPSVTVIHGGSMYLPSEILGGASRNSNSNKHERPLVLSTLTHWSPSTTLLAILFDFVATVQKYDPPVVSKATGANATNARGSAGTLPTRMRMRRRDIVGPVYATHEVDTIASVLLPTPMLLQTGNIVLLAPSFTTTHTTNRASSKTSQDDAYVFVRHVIPLRTIARITPTPNKSITLFFLDRQLSCRTFLTRDTDAIVATLRHMLALAAGSGNGTGSNSSSSKRSRDGGSRTYISNNNTDDSFRQVLGFLSPEHADKAKELSTKLMGKLSKYASSMTRFLRGDDDDSDKLAQAKQRDHELLESALTETRTLAVAFDRTPSRERMTEITRRYQSIAEEFAIRQNADGFVERALVELQTFLDHPAARRILSETSACEQLNRGIRVGPA